MRIQKEYGSWKIVNSEATTSMQNRESTLPKKFTVATPMYGGQCCVDYTKGMMDLQKLCIENNVELVTDFIANESLITRARNTLVANFLKSDSEYLFFIDADIGFQAHSVFRCLRSGLGVCGLAYPMKGFNEEKFLKEIQHLKNTGEQVNFETLLRRSHPPAVNLIARQLEDGKTEVKIDAVQDFLEVEKIGTGFMCIRREVLLDMIKEYPQTYSNDVIGYNNDQKYYTLFDTAIEDGRFLSEDYAFCSKWRRMGGKVYTYIFSVLYHTGFYKFQGFFLDSLDHEIRKIFLDAIQRTKAEQEKGKSSETSETSESTSAQERVEKIQEIPEPVRE